MYEEKIIWHEITTRRLTAEEEQEYIDLGFDNYEIPEYKFTCEMPEDRQEILIATILGIGKDTCVVDYDECRDAFTFGLEDYGEWDNVLAWAAMPKYKGGETDDN